MTTAIKMPLAAGLGFVAQWLREHDEPEFADIVEQAIGPVDSHADLEAALRRIVRFSGSTGGPASLVAEYRHIAETALAKAGLST